MTPALKHYNFLISKESRDRYAILGEECRNEYHSGQIRTVPKGTVVKIDFGCDTGLYAVADIDGVLHKIKIVVPEFHKVHVIERTE